MSWSDVALAAVAVACFNLLWWCLTLARRLGHIERTTKTDPLTGLGSGHWLEAERWPAALRSGLALGVAYLKLRNDQHGHALGDLYIQEAASALRQASRRGVDELFRLYSAGDEFLVIFRGPLDPARVAQALVERLRNYGVTASIGLAYSTETRYLPARVELRQAAEQACRQAKKLGGDRAVVVTAASHASEAQRAWGPGSSTTEIGDSIPDPIVDEPMAGRVLVSAQPAQRLAVAVAP
jgi:diguanylate cyclase (GGDEF)-like protein